MKSTILMTLFLAFCANLHAQNDINTHKLIKEFEKYCPIYILDNYCSQTGLTKIIQEAKLDDRIGGINATNQNNPENPEIAIKYYNNVIVFEKYQNAEYLGIFRIYFNSLEDLIAFTQHYKYLMGFVNDEENPNRFYYKDGSMNAVIQNSVPEKKLYFASCFVYQPDYCGK